jgi:hypothetical protein
MPATYRMRPIPIARAGQIAAVSIFMCMKKVMSKVKVIKKDEQRRAKELNPARTETALLEILIARNPERAREFLHRLRESVVP